MANYLPLSMGIVKLGFCVWICKFPKFITLIDLKFSSYKRKKGIRIPKFIYMRSIIATSGQIPPGLGTIHDLAVKKGLADVS